MERFMSHEHLARDRRFKRANNANQLMRSLPNSLTSASVATGHENSPRTIPSGQSAQENSNERPTMRFLSRAVSWRVKIDSRLGSQKTNSTRSNESMQQCQSARFWCGPPKFSATAIKHESEPKSRRTTSPKPRNA